MRVLTTTRNVAVSDHDSNTYYRLPKDTNRKLHYMHGEPLSNIIRDVMEIWPNCRMADIHIESQYIQIYNLNDPTPKIKNCRPFLVVYRLGE